MGITKTPKFDALLDEILNGLAPHARVCADCKNEFEIEKSDFEVLDKGYLWFKFKDLKLSDKVKHYGPFSDDKENLLKFKEKWGNVKTEGKRSYVVIDRKFKDVKSISKFIEKEFKLTKLN